GKNIAKMIGKSHFVLKTALKRRPRRKHRQPPEKSYLNWNRDSVNDELITDHLRDLSDGKLSPAGLRLAHTNDLLSKHLQDKRTPEPKQ
ncbi:MAG: DUF4290 domain-containing protein, partial [Bacteroidales bacterium]|nr:DUF4290 domain-containing protein [Bacteroidales bacterium]